MSDPITVSEWQERALNAELRLASINLDLHRMYCRLEALKSAAPTGNTFSCQKALEMAQYVLSGKWDGVTQVSQDVAHPLVRDVGYVSGAYGFSVVRKGRMFPRPGFHYLLSNFEACHRYGDKAVRVSSVGPHPDDPERQVVCWKIV